MPKISVMTITYNRSTLLRRSISCILSQTFTDFEYIIINNGSTDDTQCILDEFSNLDSRIKTYTMPQNILDVILTDITNQIIFENEECPYWLLLDDDDFMKPNTLEVLFHLATSTQSDITCVGSFYAYADGHISNKYVYPGTFTYNKLDGMFELLKREKINSARGGKLYKKDVLKNIDYPNVPRIRDIHREYRVMNNIKTITMTGIPLYYFYRHTSNMSGLNTASQITEAMLQEHLHANKLRTDWLSEHLPEISSYVTYCEYSFMISLCNKILTLNINDCHSSFEQMRLSLISAKKQLQNSVFLTKNELDILKKLKILNP